MARKRSSRTTQITPAHSANYDGILADVVGLLESARQASARTVNAIMTATYWQIGRLIVEHEQSGAVRAEYGEALIERLAGDLTRRFGRGLGRENLRYMRRFYLVFPENEIPQTPSGDFVVNGAIPQTLSGESTVASASTIRQTPSAELAKSKWQTPSAKSTLSTLAQRFPLPWSAYVRLLSVDNPQARTFYEAEALRGGWSVRQLDRQIDSQFYERTALSRDKAAIATMDTEVHICPIPNRSVRMAMAFIFFRNG